MMKATEANKKREGDREPVQRGSLPTLLRLRGFRLLWAGELISLLGDQFYLIALPWLVLQLTGDALAVGTVLALAGIPRALFMLVGGALTDRFSPRTVMLASNLLRMALVALLALLILGSAIEIWMLYLFALAFGLMDAFFYPAQSAIVPRLVGQDQLQTANAIMQGTFQLSLFAGPVLAGYLIARFGNGAVGQDATGIGLAFAVDALTFLASATALWQLKESEPGRSAENPGKEEGVLEAIGEGIRIAWSDTALRSFFILIALSNFLVNGPIFVGIPVLADNRFAEGAAAFGVIMSAYGGGSLLGSILAGLLPRPPARVMGIVLGAIWSGLGLGVLFLGLAANTTVAATTALAMGAAQGYVVILFITWLQRRTSGPMMGRMMSLLMFASAGLLPVSNVLTGALIRIDARALFLTAGGLMVILVFSFMLNPAVRSMAEDPIEGKPRLTTSPTWSEA
jgi:MFS family permease